MAHFAQIDKNGIVQRVVVATQDFINSGVLGEPSSFIETSYNTSGGVHKTGGTPLRKNCAGVGYKYDKMNDMFVPPKKYPSWVLDKNTGNWKAPKDMPTLPIQAPFVWKWDETEQDWVKREDI